MTDQSLLGAIGSEAERIRSDGSLPPGFEERLRAVFEEIASDPAGLEAEVAHRGSQSQSPASTSVLAKAARGSRRVAAAAKRRAGPRLRSIERRGVEFALRLAERSATEAEVLGDRGRRLCEGSIGGRSLAKVSGRRALSRRQQAPLAPSVRPGPTGELGDDQLDRMMMKRLAAAPPGQVLLAESGDGALLQRLRASGLVTSGSDPRADSGSGRRGALEALARAPKASLSAVVLSRVPDRVTPARARALVRLLSTRLADGGVLVLLSANPASLESSDPVAIDLGPGRSLHAASWCHLLAEAGLEEISVANAVERDGYAVSATKRI